MKFNFYGCHLCLVRISWVPKACVNKTNQVETQRENEPIMLWIVDYIVKITAKYPKNMCKISLLENNVLLSISIYIFNNTDNVNNNYAI